jgi:hypothetical protein
MMVERIRAVWQEWSILIAALVVLFGGIIGEILDRVYNLGGVLGEPLGGVQTVAFQPAVQSSRNSRSKCPAITCWLPRAFPSGAASVGMLDVEGPIRKSSMAK